MTDQIITDVNGHQLSKVQLGQLTGWDTLSRIC